MLIDNYKDYLTKRGYSKSTVNIYALKLQKFLKNGYSENDLCGCVDHLIKEYSKSGTAYSDKDHGITRNALKRLNDYLLREYLDTFYIHHTSFNTFPSKDKYVIGYTIDKNQIKIVYNKGKNINKKIRDIEYYELLKFLESNQQHLCTTVFSTPPMTDAYREVYSYTFGNISVQNCNDLFDSNTPSKIRDEYKMLINKICS